MTHHHWNIEEAEAKMRADIIAARAHGEAMVVEGTAEPGFLAAQREFDEARIQFILAGMRCDNAGLDRNEYLAAAASTIGLMWGSTILSCIGNRERAVVNGWTQKALAETISPPPAGEPGHAIVSFMAPMEAGTA